MVADAILLIVCEIGVRWTEQTAHILVILRMLVLVAHLEADRGSRRFTFEHTTQKFHLVSFLSCRGDVTLSRATTVELALDKVHIDVYACRETVDDASYSYAVTLSESGESEKIAKCIPHCQIL